MKLQINCQTTPVQRTQPQGQRSPHAIPAHPPGLWLKTLAVGSLLLSAGLVQADMLTFADGLTHSISDASYKDQHIMVQNGTTLILESGAMLGGLGDGSGEIDAYDTSTVIIRSGAMLGDMGFYSGAVIAHDAATVTINGGTFGGLGWPSGAVIAHDTSKVTINEATFRFTGITLAYDTSTVTIRASNFDTTSFNPTVGGMLGATFCSGTEQYFLVLADLSFRGTIVLAPCVNEIPIDTDGDGVTDDQDACPNSDLRGTVWIGGCDSGVPNDLNGALVDEDGRSLADDIAGQLSTAATGVRKHGEFVAAMAHYLNSLASSGIITLDEESALIHCIGSADHSQFAP